MKKGFEKRIRSYIIFSMVILVVLNSLTVMHLMDIVDDFIGANGEYAAIEMKGIYETAYELETYYLSNSSEYNRYYLEQWYTLIEIFYQELQTGVMSSQSFYAYLEEVESSTGLDIAIFSENFTDVVYPNQMMDNPSKTRPVMSAEVIGALNNGENVLLENQQEDMLVTTKIMKMKTGQPLMVSLNRKYIFDDFSANTAIDQIEKAFDESDRYTSYYILNTSNEVVMSNDVSLKNKVLDVKDKDLDVLTTLYNNETRKVYRDTFYVNQQIYTNSAYYQLPLSDGKRLVLIVDESYLYRTMNRITFVAILITFVGVIILYFMGTVMIFLVERYNLTAHRVTNSNQVNRMILVIFAVLMLLNGMAIVQINKVVFTRGYQEAALKSLENYAAIVEEREDQFKRFVNMTRHDAVAQSSLIYKGLKLTGDDLYIPNHEIKKIKSIQDIASEDRDIKKSIQEKGYFEYYTGPKLFRKDDFDTFYENYVLEQLPGENLHAINRVMIYPALEGEGYYVLKKDIGRQMDMLNDLRTEFKDLCKPNANEIFISNITVYSDTGIVVNSNNSNEKFESRKLKDELTGYPLWYWYQFKHNQLFRTVVRAIDGTYKENYSLVLYQDDYEYYFVYSVPRKIIFEKMERLYNVYVSAMMFLLVSVFLTLGIRIKVKRKE